jgi:glycosyltransferase involved in cell wall biosynthesis
LYEQHVSFELIIVDQNPDDRLLPIVRSIPSHIPLQHVRVGPGLTRARNLGMSLSKGSIIAFPDDDCVYPRRLLARVGSFFSLHEECDGLTGRPTGDHYFDNESGWVSRFNVWKRGIEYALFIRRSLIERVGMFDESHGLGVAGKSWWGGDGTDYLLAALDRQCRLYYDASLTVDHPGPMNDATLDLPAQMKRSYCYALGKGRVLRKRGLPGWFVTYQCMRPVAGAALAAARREVDQARIYLAACQGLLRGWRGLAN